MAISVRNRPMPAAPVASSCASSSARPVGRGGRAVAQGGPVGGAGHARLLRPAVHPHHLALRAQHQVALVGIQHRLVAGLRRLPRAAWGGERRQAEGAGQDGGMAGRRGLLDHHPGDAAGVPFEQLGRAQPAGQQQGARRHRRRLPAIEGGEQAADQVLDIGQALAQVGVGHAAHAVAQVGGDAVHRGLGRKPAAHRIGHALQPAAVGGHQLVGIQDLARGGGIWPGHGAVGQAGGDQRVDPLLHAHHRLVQPGEFAGGVLGQQAVRGCGGAGHQHRADRHPRGQRHAGEAARQGIHQRLLAGLGGMGGEQLGEQHRHRLHHLHLVGVVVARGAVLHGEHAQGAAGAAHRHGEHGGVAILAGLGPPGEGGVVLRVGEVLRQLGGGGQAHDALAHAQPGHADRLRAQALRGGQLQHLAGAHHVDRAHLADQFGRHQANELRHRGRAARHEVAQPGQKAARRGHGTEIGQNGARGNRRAGVRRGDEAIVIRRKKGRFFFF
jgi:hypothetical protein